MIDPIENMRETMGTTRAWQYLTVVRQLSYSPLWISQIVAMIACGTDSPWNRLIITVFTF